MWCLETHITKKFVMTSVTGVTTGGRCTEITEEPAEEKWYCETCMQQGNGNFTIVILITIADLSNLLIGIYVYFR